MAITRQHVEHAGRNAGLDRQLGDADGGQRGFFRRLEDHRVTGRQRRAQLPAGHHQREVPRHDGRYHTDRLAGDQAQLVMRGGRDFVVDLVDGLAAPAQGLCSLWHIHGQRIADRLAHVQGFQQGQLVGVGFEQFGETNHHLLSVGRRQARPDTGSERGPRHFNRAIGVGGGATGDGGQHAPIDRADALEGLPFNGVGVVTGDERSPFYLQCLCACFPGAQGWMGHDGAVPLCGCPSVLQMDSVARPLIKHLKPYLMIFRLPIFVSFLPKNDTKSTASREKHTFSLNESTAAAKRKLVS
ncbi:hypothetical protein D3C84_425680 [compost metagenome]